MRILYFNYEWDLQKSLGARTHLLELSQGLRGLGHEVVRLDRHRKPAREQSGSAPDPSENSSRGSLHQKMSPFLHEGAALARAIRGIPREISIIREARPDVILSRYALHQFSSLVAARWSRIPVVLEVNAPLSLEYRRHHQHYHLIPGLSEWIEVRTLSHADGVFVVSETLKSHFVDRGVPAHKIRVVPNGADITLFKPDLADSEIETRFSNDEVVVGFVGSFARIHGIETLKEAVSFLLPRFEKVKFLFVGSGPLSPGLQDFCETEGFSDRVVFTGRVERERVPGLIGSMDIVLAPYVAQEFFYLSPIKIFEYLAAGRAILATRIGQIEEVIEDGTNGLLYEAADVDSFQEQLSSLVKNSELRHRLARNARSAAESRFTWKKSVNEVASLLDQVRHQKKTADHLS